HERLCCSLHLLPGDPGAPPGSPRRCGAVLSGQSRRAPPRTRALARRSLDDPAASAPERLAPHLLVLHDLRSADHAGFPPGSLPVRVFGRAARPLPRLLHADAAGALHRAHRALPAHAAHRQTHSRRAVRMDRSDPARSPLMIKSRFSRLQAGVAVAALLAIAGPAAAFCGFYVAQADSKLFNKSSKVVLTRDGN